MRANYVAWNKGRLLGQKPPFKLKEIWSLRVRLQLASKRRDLALFNLALDSKALQLWGQLLAARGDMDGAMGKWEESLLASPGSSRALALIVQELRKVGRQDEVMKRLKQRTDSYPRESYAWAELASISIDEGDDAAAQRYNKKALALNPYEPLAMFNEAQLLDDRDPAAALVVAQRMERAVSLTQDPKMRALALGAQVNALVSLREYGRARSIAENYIAAAPLDYQGYYRLAQALTPMHEYEGALEAANKAIAMGSRSAYIMRARALLAKGDLEAARSDAEINLQGFRKYALMLFGDIFLEQSQPAAAAARYREAIGCMPDRPDGYIGLGRALAIQGDTSGAERQFKKAIEKAPMFGAPYLYWGEMLAANGDGAGAIEKYKKALSLHPKWGKPYALWAEALAAQGDAPAAREMQAKALELEPRNPQFQKYSSGGNDHRITDP